MNPREMRGRHIAESPDQITRISDGRYTVNSQSRDRLHDVISTELGWRCSCEDHRFRRTCCKHIHAVEISLQVHRKVMDDVVISEVKLDSCKYCNSDRIVRMGIRHNKQHDIQMYRCNDCSRKFSVNLGFENMMATPDHITMAMNLYFNGESLRKTRDSLGLMGLSVSYSTINRWNKKYVKLMDRYLDKITPQVGESWRTDELYLKIKGDRKYLFAMLDSETRFWLAQMVSEHKGNDDVSPMFKEAKKRAGKVPSTLISDGASNFHHAWKNQYKAKNFLHKDTEHRRHIHLAGDMNNNQMESFNGNTLRMREKVVRGIKRDDSAILRGMQIHHNYIRPHQGLDGDTPADRAGIRILGENKWKTIIQNATKLDLPA